MTQKKIRELFECWYRFSLFVWERFQVDGCTFIAAGLALTSLLSIVPLMAVALAIFSAFPEFSQLVSQVQDFLFRNFVPASGAIVQQYFKDFVVQAQRLQLFGVAFLILTALALMATIDKAFNTIWRVKAKRQWIRIFLLYWVILTLGPLLVGFSVGLTSYFVSLPIISDAAEQVGAWAATFLPFALTGIALTLAYISIPNCKVLPLHALFGGIIAALLFELTKRGFAFYITLVPTYKLIFGALAAVPIFFVWVYLSWLVVLLGAEIAHGFGVYQPGSQPHRDEDFIQALQVLGLCHRYHIRGEPVTKEKLLMNLSDLFGEKLDYLLSALLEADFIGELSEGGYVLQWDLREITLARFHKLLPWSLPDSHASNLTPTLARIFNQADQVLEKALSVPLSELMQEIDLKTP